MRVIVPIHNAVNERAWAEILGWEEGQGGEGCGGVRLVSFKGRPRERTPRARWKMLLGYVCFFCFFLFLFSSIHTARWSLFPPSFHFLRSTLSIFFGILWNLCGPDAEVSMLGRSDECIYTSIYI